MTAVVVVRGGGGVGKTTVAAAIAALAAKDRRRTLVITVDPARRLADAMGIALSNEPTPVPGLDGLRAAMLDASTAWDDIARRHADPSTAQRLLTNPLFRAIADRFPAGQAYAAGEQVLTHVEEGRYDLVVVDTPPGDAGTAFFDAPARIRHLLAGRALRILTGAGLPGRRLLYSVTAKPVLHLADRILGSRLLEDVAEFLVDLRAVYDGVRERSRDVERVLGGAGQVIVTVPSLGALAHVSEYGGSTTALVINRTLPAAWGDAESGSATGSLRFWGAEARLQQAAEPEIVAAVRPTSVHRLPWLPTMPHDPEALAELAAEGELGAVLS